MEILYMITVDCHEVESIQNEYRKTLYS